MFCSRYRRLHSIFRTGGVSETFYLFYGFKSARVAPLTPRLRKFLEETVKTFAVFPRVNNSSIV